MGSFRAAHKVARAPAHHPLDHHVHPARVDGGSESEIDPATRSDPGEPEKEARGSESRSAEAAQDVHKTADHAPGLEAALDQNIWTRDHGHTLRNGSQRPCITTPSRFLITS